MCTLYTHDANMARLVISQLVIVLIVFSYLGKKAAGQDPGYVAAGSSSSELFEAQDPFVDMSSHGAEG